jgi:hypothetical protein
MRAIGGPVEHRGQRIPAMMDIETVVTEMVPYIRPFFDTISAEVNRAMEAAT